MSEGYVCPKNDNNSNISPRSGKEILINFKFTILVTMASFAGLVMPHWIESVLSFIFYVIGSIALIAFIFILEIETLEMDVSIVGWSRLWKATKNGVDSTEFTSTYWAIFSVTAVGYLIGLSAATLTANAGYAIYFTEWTPARYVVSQESLVYHPTDIAFGMKDIMKVVKTDNAPYKLEPLGLPSSELVDNMKVKLTSDNYILVKTTYEFSAGTSVFIRNASNRTVIKWDAIQLPKEMKQ